MLILHESVALALQCDKTVYKETVIDVLPYVEEDKRHKQMDHRKPRTEAQKDKNRMDVDEEVHSVSTQIVNKLGFVPRAISSRKSQLKKHSNTNKSGNTSTTT
eukprot:522085_1